MSTQSSASDPARQLLRHAVATLAYRSAKVLREAPADFSAFTPGGECRSAGAILARMGDLIHWAFSMVNGKREWHDSEPQPWDADIGRFYSALAVLDAYLASGHPLQVPAEKLLQGPIADALTHIGQLAMMRRLAGAPIKSENYFAAEIAAGRVGPEQAAPKREF